MTICLLEKDETQCLRLKKMLAGLLCERDRLLVDPSLAVIRENERRGDGTVVLMSTRYPVKDGNFLLLARKIREIDEKSHICFMSPSPEDVGFILGKLVRPSAFLLSPVEERDLRQLLSDVDNYEKNRRRQEEERVIVVRTSAIIHRFRVQDVLFFTTAEKKIVCHAGNGEQVSFYGTLSKIEADYPDILLRCHSGFLVNRGKIRDFDGARSVLRLQTGEEIPVSKRHVREVLAEVSQMRR